MNASEAKKITQEALEKDSDLQLEDIFYKIKMYAEEGRTQLEIPSSDCNIFSIKKLISLGYNTSHSKDELFVYVGWGDEKNNKKI